MSPLLLFWEKLRFVFIYLFIYLFTVVQVQLSPFSWPPLSPTSTTPTSHPTSYPSLALSMGLIYMFLDDPSSSFPHYPLPLGYCQFVLYFNVFHYILLTCLFWWLDSTYRWDHMLFIFHRLAYFTYHNAPQIHPCCCEG